MERIRADQSGHSGASSLLDYATLGRLQIRRASPATNWQISTRKLDRYMARKAQRGEMSHLLIDRFRFAAFARTRTKRQQSADAFPVTASICSS